MLVLSRAAAYSLRALPPCRSGAANPAGLLAAYQLDGQILPLPTSAPPRPASPRRDMLSYTQTSAVTRNAAEKKINSVLDFVSQSTDTQLLQVRAGRGGRGGRGGRPGGLQGDSLGSTHGAIVCAASSSLTHSQHALCTCSASLGPAHA